MKTRSNKALNKIPDKTSDISQYSPNEQVKMIKKEISKIGIANKDAEENLLYDSLFNIILVANGSRRAYLFEAPMSNKYLHPMLNKIHLAYKNIVKNLYPDVIDCVILRDGMDMLIYNLHTFYDGKLSKLFAKSITENRLNNQKKMGDFLGYECPTNHDQPHTEMLQIYMNDNQVHAEVCVDSFPKKVFDKINNFKQTLSKYNLDVTYEITKQVSNNEILSMLQRPTMNIDFIKEHKDDILNYLFNMSINHEEDVYKVIYGMCKLITDQDDWITLDSQFGEKLKEMFSDLGNAAREYGQYATFSIVNPGLTEIVRDIGFNVDINDFLD